VSTDIRLVLDIKAAWKHAKGCKKTPNDCKPCEGNIKLFGGLPLPVLSEVLAEHSLPGRFPIMDAVADKVIDAFETTKRDVLNRQKVRILTERAQFSRLCEQVRKDKDA